MEIIRIGNREIARMAFDYLRYQQQKDAALLEHVYGVCSSFFGNALRIVA